ncbi:IclR family transcriptional regulator [Desulfosediminicola ganghwensis]|uniref:IclR family transcriptional regulator n=1 Tax=Desulfosediminicola ganghwensis TaxID=2569540 RepID=UPI0010AD03F8|nr:IclR family transcriptional regulator [Desulfosediminicola ganghwensis]
MPKKVYAVSALIKANEILEFLLQKGEASFTEIHTTLGHPKSSTYKTISTLESLGFIREVGESARYTLGLRLIELGAKAAAHVDMTTEARPLVKMLSNDTERTVHLGILDGTEVIYLLKENVHGSISIDTWAGKRVGVHSTAMGKVLLAWKTEKEIDRILKGVDLVKLTPNTRVNAEEVKSGLQEVRKRGWATDDEENWKMVRCVSAPVRDNAGKVCAALSVSTLTDLDSYEQMLGITNKVIETARELSRRLGSPVSVES